MTDTIIEPKVENAPNVFTQDQIGWTPWLEPLTESELTERHYQALVDSPRAMAAFVARLPPSIQWNILRHQTPGALATSCLP